MFFIIIINKI